MNETWIQGDLDAAYVQKPKSNMGKSDNTIQQLWVAE